MSILTRNCSLSVNQILDVATAVAGRWDLGEVISSVSGDVRPFLTHDHFDAALLSDDRKILQTFETGLNTEWGDMVRSVEESPIRAIFKDGLTHMITADAQADAQFQKVGMYTTPIFEAGLRARLHVAMFINGRVIGALSFSRTTTIPYTDEDVANAMVVSSIISPYVHGLLQSDRVLQARLDAENEARMREGLRNGARALTGKLEESRAQMGMELHDQTLADLSRISRTINDKEELNGMELEMLKSDVSHCLIELRRIVDEARPAVLELFGLSEAVRHQLEKESALRPDTAVSFDDNLPHNPLALSDDIAFCFFRIAQEAIHNAFKHAAATQIDVALSSKDGEIRLSVCDNGLGLDETRKHHPGGLYNMQTRASLFGAKLDITSFEPHGTCVFLSVPIAPTMIDEQVG